MLSKAALSRTIENPKAYRQELRRQQKALSLLADQVYLQQRPVVIVFEAGEATGKGSAIRKITENLDPRVYAVHAITAPRGEAAEHHFLWRFWRLLPAPGRMAIFDRSWYRQVLNGRINDPNLADARSNALQAISDFERQLVDFGTLMFKFWLLVGPQTVEAQIISATDSAAAPWAVIEADDRRYTRLKVLNTLVGGLGEALKFDPFEIVDKPVEKPPKTSADKKKKKKKKKKV